MRYGAEIKLHLSPSYQIATKERRPSGRVRPLWRDSHSYGEFLSRPNLEAAAPEAASNAITDRSLIGRKGAEDTFFSAIRQGGLVRGYN
jgi:hypothetical protein